MRISTAASVQRAACTARTARKFDAAAHLWHDCRDKQLVLLVVLGEMNGLDEKVGRRVEKGWRGERLRTNPSEE